MAHQKSSCDMTRKQPELLSLTSYLNLELNSHSLELYNHLNFVHEKVWKIMEQHLYQHPLILTSDGQFLTKATIKEAAIQEMYTFCRENFSISLWCYLWANGTMIRGGCCGVNLPVKMKFQFSKQNVCRRPLEGHNIRPFYTQVGGLEQATKVTTLVKVPA
jgi:hypothetical protein